MTRARSKDSDQHGHLPSLIRVFAVRMKKHWVLSNPLSAQRRLWSDWAGAHVILLVCHVAAQMTSLFHFLKVWGRSLKRSSPATIFNCIWAGTRNGSYFACWLLLQHFIVAWTPCVIVLWKKVKPYVLSITCFWANFLTKCHFTFYLHEIVNQKKKTRNFLLLAEWNILLEYRINVFVVVFFSFSKLITTDFESRLFHPFWIKACAFLCSFLRKTISLRTS